MHGETNGEGEGMPVKCANTNKTLNIVNIIMYLVVFFYPVSFEMFYFD